MWLKSSGDESTVGLTLDLRGSLVIWVLVSSPRFRWWTTLAVLAVASLGAGERRQGYVRPAAVTASTVSLPHLERLPAGTEFQTDRVPTGWSQLILKSIPVLTTGDLGTVSEAAHVTAKRIRLAILADVGRDANAGTYRLRRIGVGLAAPVVGAESEDGDVIVESTNVGELSGEWSTKERIILAAGSRELNRASLAGCTPTFAILRTPTTCVVGSEHQTVEVMYPILVDPDSGRVQLFTCRPTDGDGPMIVRELDAPAVVDSPLDVKAKSFAGIPVSWSFAMIDVPPGAERSLPRELGRLATNDVAGPADAGKLEAAFRSLAVSRGR